ncbi:hypothetical protein N9N67_02195 [Bacteriovoracaceae bacterium]|nr:hypothetical protein [Bacteriovoracaceae bacterium]
MKIFTLLFLLTFSLFSLAESEPTKRKKKRVRITIDLTAAEVGKVLENIYITGGSSQEELRFFASCVQGFRSAIKANDETDYSTQSYKEFWLSNYYSLNPGDDDVTIDVKRPINIYDKNDLTLYNAELKKCVEALLTVGTVYSSR